MRSIPAVVKFELVKPTNYNGESLGEDVSGSFYRVDGNKLLDIVNVVGYDTFFYPLLSNQTTQDCDISINDGLPIQKRIGIIKAGAMNVAAGYYKLQHDSNVFLACGKQSYYWGIHSSGDKSPLANIVETGSGLAMLGIGP